MSWQTIIEGYTYESMQGSAVTDLFQISRQHYNCHDNLYWALQNNYIFEM